MKILSAEFSLKDLCRTLEVSRSGYYAWLKEDLRPRARANAQLVVEIKSLFARHQSNYGSPRITQALRQQKRGCNHKRIERLMRLEGLRAGVRKRFEPTTTDSKHDHPIALNL